MSNSGHAGMAARRPEWHADACHVTSTERGDYFGRPYRFPDNLARCLALVGRLFAGMLLFGALFPGMLFLDALFLNTASAELVRIARGGSQMVQQELGVTFWVDFERYGTLPPGEEKTLIADPVIRAPEGVEVATLDLSVREETYQTKPHPALKGPQEVQSYPRYVIAGRWDVRVGENCAEGKQTISIRFPKIDSAAEELGAGKDPIRGRVPAAVSIDLEVFPDQAALDKQLAALEEQRAAERRPEYLVLVLVWSFVGCIVLFVVYAIIRIALVSRGLGKSDANEKADG
jgi:hypothetical protein